MLRMSKNKNEESEKLRVSINEIDAQLAKCENIEDIHVDVAKYDQILENMRRNLEEKPLGDASDESVDLVKMKEILLEKEEILNQAMQEIENLETEYKDFIEQQKEKLQDPEAELSRIKVKVKQKREKINNLVISQMAEQIVEVIYNAENILRNAQVQRENGISLESSSELPVEELEKTRKLLEEDEKELYTVRKSIHASKEILSFMEFRFSEIERMMSKGGYKDVKAEWLELQQKKKSCEDYVNKKQSLVRTYVERLFEVRQELQEIENPVKSEEKKTTAPEEELQTAIDRVKAKIDTFQEKVEQLLKMKEIWNQEIIAMEMTLEDLWRKI